MNEELIFWGFVVLVIISIVFTLDYYTDGSLDVFCKEKGFDNYEEIMEARGFGHEILGVKCYTNTVTENCTIKAGSCKSFLIEDLEEWRENYEKFWSLWD